MAPVRLSTDFNAFSCILILAAAMVFRFVESQECDDVFALADYQCNDMLSVNNIRLDMDVDCATGLVDWYGRNLAGHAYPRRIIVKVECGQLKPLCHGPINNHSGDSTHVNLIVSSLPFENNVTCVFRSCYQDSISSEFLQALPQTCPYTGLPATSIRPSSTNIQTQTINLTTIVESSLFTTFFDTTQTLTTDLVATSIIPSSSFSIQTQTITVVESYSLTPLLNATTTKSSDILTPITTDLVATSIIPSSSFSIQTQTITVVESSSLTQDMPILNATQTTTIKSSETPSSLPIGTETYVMITLGIIVLILVCVSLLSVMLTLKIKRSVRFSGSKEMNEISEEKIFEKDFEIFYKGKFGSCTSFITIVQPLQKDEQPTAVTNPLNQMNTFPEHDAETSVNLQEQTILPIVKSFDIKPGTVDDDCGYLEYNDKSSNQYLSFYSSKCSSYNALDTETYDDLSLYSQ